jgi:carboxymethylenebutenolidase
MAQYEEIRVDGVPMRILYAAPAVRGPHPAIVIMFHRDAFDAFTHKLADDLAAKGYVAAAPDVYHWPPVAATPRENPLPRDPGIIKDVAATVDWLGKRADVDMKRLGIMGHCMGGRMSFVGASNHPAFRACVVYYGGNMFVAWSDDGPTGFEMLKGLRCPVAGFFGNDDQNPSPADVDRIDAELSRLGIEHSFHRYDGAGHAFQNFISEQRYRPEPTRESWKKTIEFLDRTLKA